MAENSKNAMNPTPEGDRALDSLAREWFPLMSKRELSSDELQRVRELQGRFSTMPDADRERLKDMIRQMQQDAKPMFLGGPKGEEAPETQPTPNAMRAGLGRLAVSPAKLKDVADLLANAMSLGKRTAPELKRSAEDVTNKQLGGFSGGLSDVPSKIAEGARAVASVPGALYETIKAAEEGEPLYPKQALELGPGMVLPAYGRAAAGTAAAELGAAGGRATQVSKILNQPEVQKFIREAKRQGQTDVEVAQTLNERFRLEDDTITPRAVTGNRQRAGIGSVQGDLKTSWTSDMVNHLRALDEQFGGERGSPKQIISNFRELHPEYTGTDGTLTNMLYRTRNLGGVNEATGASRAAGVPESDIELGVAGGKPRNSWTPDMVETLRDLKAQHGNNRRKIIEDFRDAHPEYSGSDGTLTVQMSKVERSGGVNDGLQPGPQSGKLTPEMQKTIADLAGQPDMRLKDKIDAFRATHNFEGSNGTIARRLKEAEGEGGGEFELGAFGGRGPGGRIMPEDVQSIADKLGADVRLTKDTDKNGTVYMSVKSAENPGDARWDTVVRIPTDNKSHAGRRIPGSSQYVIDTTDANPKRIDPSIATNMGGGRYSDIDNLEAALRARSGDKSIPPEQRPAPQQLTLAGKKIFPRERVEPRVGEPKPGEPPPDPNQLKLLSGGVPIGPFETTVEQEPGTSSFAKSSDIQQAQNEDELMASRARQLSDKLAAHSNAIDGLTYPRLRFGLPPGFVLDKPNAMSPTDDR